MTLRRSSCILCGSHDLYFRPYLKDPHGSSLLRELIYAIPNGTSKAIGTFIPYFKTKIWPVLVNKQFFSGHAFYCTSCETGWHEPLFDANTLKSYYEIFYWKARSTREFNISPNLANAMPNPQSLSRSLDRITWLRTHIPNFNSVLDFGAGDCAASWVFKHIAGIERVAVSDLSVSVQKTAKAYSLDLAPIEEANGIDLIFSSHSIEHVENFVATMEHFSSCLSPKGFIFIETPNIASLEIFNALVHTPHTFMLSLKSFLNLPTSLGLEVVKAEAVGPPWQKARPYISDDARADLRVLLRKAS